MVQLARYPQIALGQVPTPLEPMERLTRHLRERHPNVPTLWIKRDDCTGLATGGNKTRKLEFLMGEALRDGADTLVTQGATQSNHVRQTAAAAAREGMRCKLLLEQRLQRDNEYQWSGNVLLDELLGADIVSRPAAGTDMQSAIEGLAESLRTAGHRPYVIPGGGSNPVGALGYVACAQELETAPVAIDWIVHGSGSGGTQAGLIAGLQAIRSDIEVLGVSVKQKYQQQVELVHDLAQRTAAHLGLATTIARDTVRVDDRWIGDNYGVPTDDMEQAVRLMATVEGILLDPVYSGKAFAGLLGNIAEDKFNAGHNVVFLHTGGAAGLFGYRSTFDRR